MDAATWPDVPTPRRSEPNPKPAEGRAHGEGPPVRPVRRGRVDRHFEEHDQERVDREEHGRKAAAERWRSSTRKSGMEEMCWKKTNATGNIAARKIEEPRVAGARRRAGADAARLLRRAVARPPSGDAAREAGGGEDRAGRDSPVPPSTRKSQRKETVARKPPSAGPMLIPRLIARRFRERRRSSVSGARPGRPMTRHVRRPEGLRRDGEPGGSSRRLRAGSGKTERAGASRPRKEGAIPA